METTASVAGSSRADLLTGSVDVHAHVTDAGVLDSMAALAPTIVPRIEQRDGRWYAVLPSGARNPVPRGLADLSERLRDMDAQRIQYQALASWTSLYFYDAPAEVAAELICKHNDAILAMTEAHPDRFLAMPGLPLQDAALSVAEIERMGAFPAVAGVQINTNVNGVNLDDESLEPVWQALENQRMTVLVHPWGKAPVGRERLSKYHMVNLIGNPLESSIAIADLACSGVMARYPDLQFCFVHGGGFMPYQLGRWDHGWDVRPETRSRIDRPPSDYIGACYFDQLCHDPRSLAFLGGRFGWSQVVLGTDYPWDMGTPFPLEDLRAAGLEAEQIDQVATQNPRRLLRWPEGRD